MNQCYCKTIYEAAISNYKNLFRDGGIYEGKNGCLRLSREYGCGLADFETQKEVDNDISSSYSVLCVRAYMLKPLVDAKEWVEEIYKGFKKAKSYRKQKNDFIGKF